MLSVQNLSCRRGGRTLFRNLAFTCERGGFVLVTGGNGCGKSTLLRILAGLLPALEGKILWDDVPFRENLCEGKALFHYIGHQDALKPSLTGLEMLDYWQTLRGLAFRPLSFARDTFLAQNFQKQEVRRLSAGQKRRLSLTRLLMDQSPLWILDEPTTALDPDGERLLLKEVDRHRSEGGIVIAAMHHEPGVQITKRIQLASPLS